MAGHSHASNIKHKKERNNKAKSEFFLRVRRKIELAYNNSTDREKIFSIAREYNFPKEKVSSLIEKIEKSRQQASSFTELLYRGKYEILLYLRGNLPAPQEVLLQESVKILSLGKLSSERVSDYFRPVYLLRVSGCENIEEVILSSLPTLVIDKITKIEKREETEREVRIFFLEEEALARAAEFFTDYPDTHKLEVQKTFSPLLPIYIDSTEFCSYLSLFESCFSKLSRDLQIFTNVPGRKVGP